MKIKSSQVGRACSRLSSLFIAIAIVAPLSSANAAALLPEILVTPSRTEQRQTETLLHGTVITSEMIKNSQQPDLPSLLRAEAGIQITQTGGIGSATGFFMRGAATRQTLVLVDGIPITKQDATGTVSIEHLMLAEIDRIEIVRGNVSSIYGSGAVGGVIQIFTRRPSEKPATSISAEFGSRMSYNSAASIRGATEDIRYALSASALGTDGFSTINNRQLTSGNPDLDGYTNLSASGSISKQWSADHEVGIRFTQSQGRFGFDSRFDQPTDTHTGKTNLSLVSLFSNNRISEKWQSGLTVSEAVDRNSNRYQTAFPVSDRYRTKTQIADWLNRIDLSEALRATTGLTYQRQSLVGDDGYGGLSDFSRNIWSAQAGIEYASKNGHGFQLNGRHDGMQGNASTNTSTNTGLLGYGYRVNDTLKLIASTSTGFSAPPLGYLYGQYGNPSLRPEFSRSTDIGAQISLSELELRVTWFNARIRDQIEYSNGFKNIGAARNDGVEISGQFNFSDWSIRPSLTLQNPRDADTGQRLARRARELASLSAVRSSGPWTFNVSATYAGTRFDGDNQLGSYVLAGLSSSYKLSKEWSLISRIDNLFDERYQSVYGYNQPPRTIFAGVRWQQ